VRQLEWSEFSGVRYEVGAVHRDARGWFRELHRASNEPGFIQQNASFSKAGVLRGLHFQAEEPQSKRIQVVQGRIWDVFVDLRRGATFGHWGAVDLTDRGELLYLPAGFAHGFFARADALVHYAVSAYWRPELSRGIAWDCPELGIPWPSAHPDLSPADVDWPGFREATCGLS